MYTTLTSISGLKPRDTETIYSDVVSYCYASVCNKKSRLSISCLLLRQKIYNIMIQLNTNFMVVISESACACVRVAIYM